MSNTTNLISTENSYFDGNFWQRLGWIIVSRFLTVITLGLAYPAAVCMLLRWECKHTVINGRRLKFTGTGAQLFGKYILWWLLTIVTFGIFGIWLGLNMKKWTVKHTVYADDNTGAVSRFTGGVGGYIGMRLLGCLLTVCTFGIGFAWAKRMILNWEFSHTYISGTHLGFTGRGGQLFGKFILWGFLSVITCSIFSLFIPIKFLKWQYKHTGATPVDEVPGEKKTGIGVIIAVAGVGLAIVLIIGAAVLFFMPTQAARPNTDIGFEQEPQVMFVLNDAGMLAPTLETAYDIPGNFESCVDYDEIEGEEFSFTLDPALIPEERRDEDWIQNYFTASGKIGTTAYLDAEQDILYLDYGVESAVGPTYLCLDGSQTKTGHAEPLTNLISSGNGIHSVEYPYDEAPEYVYVMSLAHIAVTGHPEEDVFYFVTIHKQYLDVTVSAPAGSEPTEPGSDVNTGSLIGSWIGCYGELHASSDSDDPFSPDMTCQHWELNPDGTFTSYTMGYINVGGGFSEMYNPVKHLGTWSVEGNTLTLRNEVIDYPAEEPSVTTNEVETYTVSLKDGLLIIDGHEKCDTMLKDADAKDVYAYETSGSYSQSGDLSGSSSDLIGKWVILGAPETNTVPDTAYAAFAYGGLYEFREDGSFSLSSWTLAAENGGWYNLGGGENFFEGTYEQDGSTVTLHYTTTFKSVWDEGSQEVVSQPVSIDETEHIQIQPGADQISHGTVDHPRFGQLCLFQRLAEVEEPLGVLCGHLAFAH